MSLTYTQLWGTGTMALEPSARSSRFPHRYCVLYPRNENAQFVSDFAAGPLTRLSNRSACLSAERSKALFSPSWPARPKAWQD
jgi:hypothetical protein